MNFVQSGIDRETDFAIKSVFSISCRPSEPRHSKIITHLSHKVKRKNKNNLEKFLKIPKLFLKKLLTFESKCDIINTESEGNNPHEKERER